MLITGVFLKSPRPLGFAGTAVKKRLLAANTPVAATVRGTPLRPAACRPALFSVKHEAADSVH